MPDPTPSPLQGLRLIRHRPGALRLRMGLGPRLQPCGAVRQLQTLLDGQSFWAQGRSAAALRQMLQGSTAVVTAWRGDRLVGFGRASSDGIFRAVLWDVVVHSQERGHGLGRALVQTLLEAPGLRAVERVYLMTTRSSGFYLQMGFHRIESQQLMLRESMAAGTRNGSSRSAEPRTAPSITTHEAG